MKKIFIIFISLLFISLVTAVQNNSIRDESQTIGGQRDSNGCLIAAGYSWNETEQKCVREWSRGEDRYQNESNNQERLQNNSGIGQELREQIRARKEEIKSGEYNGSLGQLLRVRELAQNLRELRVNNISAETGLNITAEVDLEGKTRLKTTLKNGQEREIKLMPDTASERALERLRLKVCSEENNCSIQLKNVGSGETERIQYEVQIERHSRILGIFSKKMKVSAEVDAETGETVVNKPWWAFIATEPEE